MKRVTITQLEAIVLRINKLTNSPESSWTRVGGKLVANIVNYHLDSAYGGYKLARMCSTGGGIQDILRIGYATKGELAKAMFSFIAGIEAGKFNHSTP